MNETLHTEVMHVCPKDDVMRAMRLFAPYVNRKLWQQALGTATFRTFVTSRQTLITDQEAL